MSVSRQGGEAPIRPGPPGVTGAAAALGRDALAGALIGLVSFAYSLSFGALVFSGDLAPHAGAGVTAAAASAGVTSLVLSRLSSFPLAVGGPDTPVIAVASALAAAAAATAAPGAAAATAAAALTAAAAATAVLLLAAGLGRWASLVRFIPYPVVGGFLAASGWFLATGAVTIAAARPFEEAAAAMLREGPSPPVLATLGVAIVIAGVRAATRSALAAPGVVFLAGGAALVGSAAGVVPEAVLRDGGWLLPEVAGDGATLPLLTLAEAAPDPTALLRLSPEILSIAGVAAVAILLNAAGLEAHARADLDPDREFAASGAANVLVAAFGGLASNLSLNRSALNMDVGARGRASGTVAGLTTLSLAALGPAAGAAIPAPVLAGLVLYMGAGMLWRWLAAAARGFGLGEWLLVLAIFGAIVRFGYLEGVALGVTAACVSFALACARAPFLRQELTRRDYASYVDRPAEEEARLRAAGGRIRIWRLQGFLFFGVSARIADGVKAAIEAARREGAPLSSVILDFRAVTGADSTVRFAFARLGEFAEAEGMRLIFTGLSGSGRRSRALGAAGRGAAAEVFATLELGLEAAEERLLAELGAGRRARADVGAWLAEAMADPAAAAEVRARLEARPATAGAVICRQGEPADAMFLVAAGRVSIFLEPADGAARLRLRTALGRTVIGEIGFFTGAPRGASVVADESSEVWALTAEGFAALEREAPAAALALERLVIRVLADRLTFANREVAALQ